MSDNIDNLNETNEASAAPAKAVKAEFVPTTKGQAKMIIDRLRKGISGLHTQIDEREAKIVSLEALAETLPDTVAVAGPKAKVKLEAGTVVEFRYGRGETAAVRTGTIKARKDNAETGNPELYRVESGEGFDTEIYTVYPGQIAVKAEPAVEGGAQADVLDGVGNSFDGTPE